MRKDEVIEIIFLAVIAFIMSLIPLTLFEIMQQDAEGKHQCDSMTDKGEIYFPKFNQSYTVTIEHKGYCERI